MWQQLSLIGLFGLLWGAALWLANRCGSKQARLEALREEIRRQAREQERAHAIYNRVDTMRLNDVRKRLQNTSRN